MNYFDTYAPVVSWFAIRIIISISISLSQSPDHQDRHEHGAPKGHSDMPWQLKGSCSHAIIQPLWSKQTGHVWNSFLVKKLLSLGFQQSLNDECVFFCDDIIFVMITNYPIIKEIKKTGIDIENQGHPADYSGVTITRHVNGYCEFTQWALIDSIINDVSIGNTYTNSVPAKVCMKFHALKDSPKYSDCNFNFNYCSIAKYSSDPRKEHQEAIIYLVQYLKKTKFECYCDGDFSGNRNRHHSQIDQKTAKSRSWWIIFYAKCPIFWASTLQSQVALSTTAAGNVIPVIKLLDEMKGMTFKFSAHTQLSTAKFSKIAPVLLN
ncbi:hypothetical protein ACHAW6_006363 [Cyclotella cf. meneghiniana]